MAVEISCIEALEGLSKDDGIIDGRGVEGRWQANCTEDREIGRERSSWLVCVWLVAVVVFTLWWCSV